MTHNELVFTTPEDQAGRQKSHSEEGPQYSVQFSIIMGKKGGSRHASSPKQPPVTPPPCSANSAPRTPDVNNSGGGKSGSGDTKEREKTSGRTRTRTVGEHWLTAFKKVFSGDLSEDAKSAGGRSQLSRPPQITLAKLNRLHLSS